MAKPRFEAVHPVLPVRNVNYAIEYYTSKLGFVLRFKYPDETPEYAGIRRDGVALHLQLHAEESFEMVERLNLRFYVNGVDELFAEYKDKGIFRDQTALRDCLWGTREFAFYDPDKNGLTFYRNL